MSRGDQLRTAGSAFPLGARSPVGQWRSWRFWSLVAGVLFFLWLMMPAPAEAQSCSVLAPTLAFGTVPANGTAVTNGTVVIVSCSGTANASLRLCAYVGTGTYTAPTGGPRVMKSGANALSFDLYTTAAFTQRYVNGQIDGSNPETLATLSGSGSSSTNILIYGRIPAGATTGAPTGTYSTTFSAGTVVTFGYSATFTSCSTASGRSSAAYSFDATVTLQPTCSLSTTSVTFVTGSSLAANADAAGAVNVTCTSGASYTVTMDGGANGGTSAITRQMKLNTGLITYGLYQNSGRTTGWYNDAAGSVGGTGTGSMQSIPVYGRVFAQPTPAPGTYSDTVVVTLTY